MSDGPPRAILFDLDGTLYRQGQIRAIMAARLARHCLAAPREARSLLAGLRAFRNAQEVVRQRLDVGIDVASEQLRLAAEQTGLSEERIATWVRRWMDEEPLRHLTGAMRSGLPTLLSSARRQGVELAVVSDYPTERKLVAMGIRRYFSTTVFAQDAEVGCFKPSPRGLTVALERLGFAPEAAVYVGDRPEVDAVAAQRAGMRCVILGSGARGAATSYGRARNIQELSALLLLS